MRVAAFSATLMLAAFTQSPVAPVVTLQDSNTTELLIGLHPVDERVVWAGGARGTYLRTTDGGAHWRAGVVPGPRRSSSGMCMRSIR